MVYSKDELLQYLKDKKSYRKTVKWTCAINIDDICNDVLDPSVIKALNIPPRKVNIKLVAKEYWYNFNDGYEIAYDDDFQQLIEDDSNYDIEEELLFFDTKEECIEYYNDLMYQCFSWLADIKNRIDNVLSGNKYSFINTDYLIEKLRRGK